ALLAAGVVERERGDVELAVDQRVPLVVRLEQRSARIDLHLEADVGGLGVARDDLHHLVAHVAAPARELVRSAQRGGLLGERVATECGGKRGCDSHVLERNHGTSSSLKLRRYPKPICRQSGYDPRPITIRRRK